MAKSDATPESVDAAQQSAVADGATDAAVLDSDLYSSLPPGNYVIYSGVYTDRKSAEAALKGLGNSFSAATVVEVSDGSADAGPADQGGADSSANGAVIPGAGGESEVPPTEPNSEPGPDAAPEAVLQDPAARRRSSRAAGRSPRRRRPVAQPAASPAQAAPPAAAPRATRRRRWCRRLTRAR